MGKRICFDARHVHNKMQGLDRYVIEVLNALPYDPSVDVFILHNSDFPQQYIHNPERFNFVLSNVKGCSIAQHLLIPIVVKKLNIDCYYYPYIDPPLIPPAKKNIFMILDLNHYYFSRVSATRNPLTVLAAKMFINIAGVTYTNVMVISKFVQDQVIKAIPQTKNKTIMHYLGFSTNKFETTAIQPLLDLPKYFFLYVGNNRPHKNLENLFKAFALLINKYKEIHLLIAGNLSDRFFDVANTISKLHLDKNILILNSPTDSQLASLYKATIGFVYPSLSEGFGLPLLEAMYFNAPILTSNTSCLPEIAGNAAIYFDPTNPQCISDKMEMLFNDSRISVKLVNNGNERLKVFTWTETARILYNQLIN